MLIGKQTRVHNSVDKVLSIGSTAGGTASGTTLFVGFVLMHLLLSQGESLI